MSISVLIPRHNFHSSFLDRFASATALSIFIAKFAGLFYAAGNRQAKYDMRRLLGDLSHNIETSVFTIIDIYYKPVLNTKGLIESDIHSHSAHYSRQKPISRLWNFGNRLIE